ncbi:MAG: hypothetical protein AAF903_12530 [Pseudomonadota bacterium]
MRANALVVCLRKRVPLIEIEKVGLYFVLRIEAGGQDQKFLEPKSTAEKLQFLKENDETFDPQLLSQAFAEMENWSDQLLHNDEVLEALQSLSDGEELAVHKMRRRGPALRGPSR